MSASDQPSGFDPSTLLEASQSTRLHAGQEFGRYRLIEEIGRGGMGVVWRAHDATLEADVALKFLPWPLVRDPVAMARMRREARVLLGLTHPGIVRLHTLEEVGGVSFLVMEFLRGGTLGDVLAKRVEAGESGLTVVETLGVVERVAGALSFAHERGFVHCDLKPANVMLAEEPGESLDTVHVKLTDFGIAFTATSSLTQVTGFGPAGTPAFMAPEILDGEEPTPLADVYALAGTIYMLLHGAPPFRHGDLGHQVRTRPAPPLNSGDPALDATVARALAKNPKERPPSVAAFVEWMRSGPPETRVGGIPPAGTPASKHKGALVGLLSAIVLVLVLGAWTRWRDDAEGPSGTPLDGTDRPLVLAEDPPRIDAPAESTAEEELRVQGDSSRARGPDGSSEPGLDQLVRDTTAPRLLESSPPASRVLTGGDECRARLTFAEPLGRFSIDPEPEELVIEGASVHCVLRIPAREALWRPTWLAQDLAGNETAGELEWSVVLPGALPEGFEAVDQPPAVAAGSGYVTRVRDPRTGLVFRLVESGVFRMGSASKDALPFEGPPHEVEISRPFYLAEREVSVAAWSHFAEETSYRTDPEGKEKARTWSTVGTASGTDHPVTMVSWFDANRFCSQYGYRLPTEAEWELACRAGTDSEYWWGDTLEGGRGRANLPDASLGREAVVTFADSYTVTSPVGSFEPNPWGFFDLVGNVMEWCLDGWDGEAYSEAPQVDPLVGQGAERVVRGGSFRRAPHGWRSSFRWRYRANERFAHVGFRPVVEP